jgi:hypothetical protein
VWWAWLDLNQRPHPYQVSRAKRCADLRYVFRFIATQHMLGPALTYAGIIARSIHPG